MRKVTFFFLLSLILACSAEPGPQQFSAAKAAEAVPYLYKIPTSTRNGLPVARVKKEALAEAFVSRLSAKAPAGVVVLQHEMLVLEEYYKLDSAANICVGPLFPAYTAALLGVLFSRSASVPFEDIPLQTLYPLDAAGPSLIMTSFAKGKAQEQEAQGIHQMNAYAAHQVSLTQSMAAEERLFEPLRIDAYTWQAHSLCMHPHGLLKMSSLLLRRGRWGDHQLLPDMLVQRILEPAYTPNTAPGHKAFGWQYYRLVAKGRKHPVLYWENGAGAHLFLLPEVEAVVLILGGAGLMPEAREWLQQYLIPSLTP